MPFKLRCGYFGLLFADSDGDYICPAARGNQQKTLALGYKPRYCHKKAHRYELRHYCFSPKIGIRKGDVQEHPNTVEKKEKSEEVK